MFRPPPAVAHPRDARHAVDRRLLRDQLAALTRVHPRAALPPEEELRADVPRRESPGAPPVPPVCGPGTLLTRVCVRAGDRPDGKVPRVQPEEAARRVRGSAAPIPLGRFSCSGAGLVLM